MYASSDLLTQTPHSSSLLAIMVTAQATKNIINLRGSTQIVTEFFGYAINSILYQRGIYPAETFTTFQNYGLQMMVTTDPGLRKYLGNVLNQLSGVPPSTVSCLHIGGFYIKRNGIDEKRGWLYRIAIVDFQPQNWSCFEARGLLLAFII